MRMTDVSLVGHGTATLWNLSSCPANREPLVNHLGTISLSLCLPVTRTLSVSLSLSLGVVLIGAQVCWTRYVAY
jgi:hypothetical protein